MGSANLAAARPAAHPPPTRTVTTIPLQSGGLRGKKWDEITWGGAYQDPCMCTLVLMCENYCILIPISMGFIPKHPNESSHLCFR